MKIYVYCLKGVKRNSIIFIIIEIILISISIIFCVVVQRKKIIIFVFVSLLRLEIISVKILG